MRGTLETFLSRAEIEARHAPHHKTEAPLPKGSDGAISLPALEGFGGAGGPGPASCLPTYGGGGGTPSQKVWAILVAFALVAGGIGSCAQGLVAYHDWACRTGHWSVVACAGEVESEPEQSEKDYLPPARRP
jgi:hypothetical protein